MKLTIDRSKWRCGGDKECGSNNQRGKGDTSLRNEEGYMCCLGFYSLACGYSEEDITYDKEPCDVVHHDEEEPKNHYPDWLVLPSDGDDYYYNTLSADVLMGTNDNDHLNEKQREEKVTEQFAEHDVEVEFIGEYE